MPVLITRRIFSALTGLLLLGFLVTGCSSANNSSGAATSATLTQTSGHSQDTPTPDNRDAPVFKFQESGQTLRPVAYGTLVDAWEIWFPNNFLRYYVGFVARSNTNAPSVVPVGHDLSPAPLSGEIELNVPDQTNVDDVSLNNRYFRFSIPGPGQPESGFLIVQWNQHNSAFYGVIIPSNGDAQASFPSQGGGITLFFAKGKFKPELTK